MSNCFIFTFYLALKDAEVESYSTSNKLKKSQIA